MFDCVLPTRNGRNAYAFTATGPLRLRNSRFTADAGPIEPGCDCYACRNFSRGALRHYFFASEMLGPILVSLHNIRFFQRLMADIRRAIGEGDFDRWRRTDPRAAMGPSSAEPGEPGQTQGEPGQTPGAPGDSDSVRVRTVEARVEAREEPT
jgi:queuine tRNA-ribosyltransferase